MNFFPVIIAYTYSDTPVLLGEFYGNYPTGTARPEFIAEIDDRRIQLKQIRQLFPECAKMPLAIALDYVRVRM